MGTLEIAYRFILRFIVRSLLLFALLFSVIAIAVAFGETLSSLPSIAAFLGIRGVFYENAKWGLVLVPLLLIAAISVRDEEMKKRDKVPAIETLPEDTDKNRSKPDWLERLENDEDLIPTIRKVYEDAGVPW